MNPAIFCRKLVVLCTLGLLPPLGFAQENAMPTEPVLKVQVNTPRSWNVLVDHRAQENLASGIREALSRENLHWRVAPLQRVEDPAKAPHLLKVDVTAWRFLHDGNIECTFTATLQTPAGERPLGPYTSVVRHRATDLVPHNPTKPKAAFDAAALTALSRDLAASGPIATASNG